jgi:arabinosaccharide transport system substrate-binding protein
MIDGLCLFYICPDWRSRQIEVDIPSLKGKLGLMPLPAWEPGGLRTSTWGGTGLSITKQCRNPDLAWKLAMYLYYDDPPALAERFAGTNILPPLKAAWDQPQLSRPSEFWSGLPLGKTYAALAPFVPPQHDTAYNTLATGKFSEAYTNTTFYYAEHGENGLRDFARGELKRCADRVRMVLDRNVFLKESEVAMKEPSP